MAKVTYSSLKLKTNNDVEVLDFNGINIEVLQYLPIENKYDLAMITLQNSKENEIFNPVKIDMYFHLYLVYMYTNISFTEKQKEDESKLYDTLLSNGLIDAIVDKIPAEEYELLYSYINDLMNLELEYNTTAAAIIRDVVNNLPKQAQEAQDIMNNFNLNQYKELLSAVEAIG